MNIQLVAQKGMRSVGAFEAKTHLAALSMR